MNARDNDPLLTSHGDQHDLNMDEMDIAVESPLLDDGEEGEEEDDDEELKQ